MYMRPCNFRRIIGARQDPVDISKLLDAVFQYWRAEVTRGSDPDVVSIVVADRSLSWHP